MRSFPSLFTCSVVFAAILPVLHAADKNILLISGPPSHGAGFHEYNAGVLLLQKCLEGYPGLKVEVVSHAWPTPAAILSADAIFLSMDGGAKHPALEGERLAELDRAMRRGAGLGLLHFATEPTKEKGEEEFLRWVGAAFEPFWSVNPHWHANFTSIPTHPVTRGVKPFTLLDEWYFHLRFAEGGGTLTPLLVAVPDPEETTKRPDGHHSGNPAMRAAVARGEPQTLAWAFERPDGGRGFGLTGGHFHTNWADENFRKLVLNSILWIAKVEVPANGVQSTVSAADLAANLDPKPKKK